MKILGAKNIRWMCHTLRVNIPTAYISNSKLQIDSSGNLADPLIQPDPNQPPERSKILPEKCSCYDYRLFSVPRKDKVPFHNSFNKSTGAGKPSQGLVDWIIKDFQRHNGPTAVKPLEYQV